MTLVHQPTITEIVSFVLRYRVGTNAFDGANSVELYEYIQESIVNSNCLVDSSDFGDICGVISAQSFIDDKRLHIIGLLCLRSSSLYKFAYWLQKQTERNNWTITATRRGRIIEYKDTQKLLNKLIGLYGRLS